ncbi:hypothetical protein MASR2M17_09350 [Aminivibrio sp.]
MTTFRRVWRDGISPTLEQAYEDLLFPKMQSWLLLPESRPPPALLPIRCTERPKAPRRPEGAPPTSSAGLLLALRGTWDSGLSSPAEWRDMTILVPTRSSFGPEDTLSPRHGIPVAFERGKEISAGRSEISGWALQTIAFPDDRHALLSFLSTPFSGLTLEELPPLFAPGAPPLEDLYPGAAERIEDLRRKARYAGLFSALAELLRDQSVLLFWLLLAARRTSVRRKGLDLVREYEEVFRHRPGGVRRRFLAWMASRPSGAGEEGTPRGRRRTVRGS